jgi:hypothetical protein
VALHADREHLLARLAALEARLVAAVEVRRSTDPTPDDPMRGLYLTEGHIARLASDGEAFAFALTSPPPAPSAGLAALAVRAGLDEVDVEVLTIAVAPDIDPRFERYYGYLHDDVTRRRASVGLSLKLAGADLADATARRRLGPDGPLVRASLVTVEDSDRPFLSRALRVPDRVVTSLLGDDRLDPELTGLRLDAVLVDSPVVDGLSRALQGGARLVYLQERNGGTGRHAAAMAFASVGKRALVLDFDQLAPGSDVASLVRAAHREALLTDAGVVAGPVDDLTEREPAALRALAGGSEQVVLTGVTRWDPLWSSVVPLVLEPPALVQEERAGLWREVLNGDAESGLDPGEATAAFRLGPDQIVRAARSARLRALYAGRPVATDDLHAGARSQNSAGLQRLSRRIEPWATWDELILPADTAVLLREHRAGALPRAGPR